MGLQLSGSLQYTGSITVTGSLDAPVSVQSISMQGTSSAGTNVLLNYGINVITASSATNFCAKLPNPVKGKSVIVVNNTSYKARIFPSSSAGTLNGITNGFTEVQPNKLAINFTCYDNPSPGGWGVLSPAGTQANTLTYPVLEINHVSGSASDYGGVNTLSSMSQDWGAGIDAQKRIILYPSSSYWKYENFAAVTNRIRIHTNITGSDMPEFDNDFDGSKLIYITFAHAGLSSPNGFYAVGNPTTSVYSYTAGQYTPNNSTIFATPYQGYPVNTSTEIGDAGTIYVDRSINPQEDIGYNGPYSPYYYIFIIHIGAAFPTKTYKFRFELDFT